MSSGEVPSSGANLESASGALWSSSDPTVEVDILHQLESPAVKFRGQVPTLKLLRQRGAVGYLSEPTAG